MADTTYRPGDYSHCILRKWLDKLGGDFQFGDSEHSLLRKILAQTPGSEIFQFGDGIYELARKILTNLTGTWQPGDLQHTLWRKILNEQAPGTPEEEAMLGDLISILQRKILERTP